MPLILFRNEAYDKFYIVNYLEFGKTWSGARKAGRTNDDFDDELPTGFENETGKSHIPSICKINSQFWFSCTWLFFTYLCFISGFDDEDEDEEEEDDELGTRLGGAIENDWSDWRGDLSGAVCLFCPGEHKSENATLKIV